MNDTLITLFNDYAMALWKARQWWHISQELRRENLFSGEVGPIVAAELKYRESVVQARKVAGKICRMRREIGEAAYHGGTGPVDPVFLSLLQDEYVGSDDEVLFGRGVVLQDSVGQLAP